MSQRLPSPWEIDYSSGLTREPHQITAVTANGTRRAYVYENGCLEYIAVFNEETQAEDLDQIHICSLTLEIARLEGLRDLARRVWGDDWDAES